jgi:hypothetical protein
MCEVPRDDQALVIELQRHVDTVHAVFRDHWKRARSRQRGRLKRLLAGTSPRSRYQVADELMALRDALMELILTAEGMATITELQRNEVQRIGKEIDRWSPDGTQIPELEELWQIVCDVECLTIQVADDGWLDRRLEQEASHLSTGGRMGIDGSGRDGVTVSPGTGKSHRDTDSVRHRLLDEARRRTRLARQRRGHEQVRAERLMSGGVQVIPVAFFTAVLFSWAVYWQPGDGPESGYVSVRTALAVFAGARTAAATAGRTPGHPRSRQVPASLHCSDGAW